MRFSLYSIVFGMSLCLAAPAIAFDPTGDAAVDALFERFEADALVTVTYASASTTTGTTTLTTVAFDPTGDAPTLTMATLEFSGGRVSADGLPTFESMALADAFVATDEGRMTIGSMSAVGVRFRAVPADADVDESMKLSALAPPFDRFEMSDFTLDVDGPNPLTLSVASILATANEYADGIPMITSVSLIGTLTVPVLVDDPLAEAILVLMDLEEPSFDLDLGASINGDTNTITLSPLKVTMKDMAAVSLDLVLGGIGVDSFKAAQDAMTDARIQAPGMRAMSGSLVSASVRTDVAPMGRIVAFMTSKILEEDVAGMGTRLSDLTTRAKLLLGELGDPELQDRIVAAVTTFLEAPGNLTVSASPTEPLPFGAIVAGSRNIPQLVRMLNLDIVANQ